LGGSEEDRGGGVAAAASAAAFVLVPAAVFGARAGARLGAGFAAAFSFAEAAFGLAATLGVAALFGFAAASSRRALRRCGRVRGRPARTSLSEGLASSGGLTGTSSQAKDLKRLSNVAETLKQRTVFHVVRT
jgi:hypothetical protein